MKIFSHILPMLVLTLTAFAVSAQAATLTIQDEQAPHAPILRYESFLATLVATVHDEPKSNDEIEVTGPTFEWKGGGDGLTVQPSGTARTQIDSGNSPRYGTVEALKENGYKKAQVTCVATYSRKKKTGEVLTPISVSGALTVDFFVRVPKRVYSTGKTAYYFLQAFADGTPWKVYSPWPKTAVNIENGKEKTYVFPFYGSGDIYTMELTDNRSALYPYGQVFETFKNPYPAGAKPDGDRNGYVWTPPTWEDTSRYFQEEQLGVPARLLAYDQLWWLRENGEVVPLNTHHVEITGGGTDRSYLNE